MPICGVGQLHLSRPDLPSDGEFKVAIVVGVETLHRHRTDQSPFFVDAIGHICKDARLISVQIGAPEDRQRQSFRAIQGEVAAHSVIPAAIESSFWLRNKIIGKICGRTAR